MFVSSRIKIVPQGKLSLHSLTFRQSSVVLAVQMSDGKYFRRQTTSKLSDMSGIDGNGGANTDENPLLDVLVVSDSSADRGIRVNHGWRSL